jgi:hypothetical protein
MSTRFTKQVNHKFAKGMGYEGTNIPDDFELPSCTLEDVDRAVFDLFNGQIPIYAKINNETKRAPVIFATGERFALLRRKQPLRDEQNALILPLVSILRDSINNKVETTFGAEKDGQIVVKRRLSSRDSRYQKVINKLGFENANNQPSTRRTTGEDKYQLDSGKVLQPTSNNNIYETIVIPSSKKYEANYEITVWAQYTTQMNDMLMAIMSSYQNMQIPEFRLETKSGYWFVGYVDDSFSQNSNYDDFTNEERIIKYSFNMRVPAYLINSVAPGVPGGVRSFISAPTIQFELCDSPNLPAQQGGPVEPDVNAFILENVQAEDTYAPGQALGSDPVESGKLAADLEHGDGAYRATSDSRDATDTRAPGVKSDTSANVGGFSKSQTREYVSRTITDPSTGETKNIRFKVTGKVAKRGETILRGESGLTLDDIIVE